MGDCKALSKYNVYDDFFTPKWVWEKVKKYVDIDLVIWEACMLNAVKSNSANIWRDWGYSVISDTDMDILEEEPNGYDIIITNIPFNTELKKKILRRLMELDKPFIIIMNVMNVFANYFGEIMNTEHIQVIYPRGKLHFEKDGNKEIKNTSFYSVFVAYKLKLSNEDLIGV